MNSAESKLKAAERAARTAFLTMGVALLSSFLTSEGPSGIIWPVLGLIILGVGLSGLIKRGVSSIAQRMGESLLAILSLTTSGAAALFLALFPLGLGLGSGVGMSIPTQYIVAGVIAAFGCLANVVILILNVAHLAGRQPAP
jgi:hypothetical protein